MAIHDLSGWRHSHAFDPGNLAGERRTWLVVALNAITMVAEIVAGFFTGAHVSIEVNRCVHDDCPK